ncbi:hypothetical protein ACWDDN_07545 [Streptomyces griseoruber]|uniref:hypothetical protein n=1 Tax=Streptomyces griseoruber TaxID=1943 RepID=UPI00378F3112
MRRIARGLVTAGAVLFSTLAMPVTAHAVGPNVLQAYSDQADWSVVDVRLNYGSEIDKVTVGLRPVGSSESEPPVATVTDFKQTYYVSQWEGVWSSPPVHLDTLGDYTIDVEATNTAGETTVQKDAGTLRYRKQPVFTDFAVTPTEPDIEHRTVTATGAMVVRDPSTRETSPFAGATVNLDLGRLETTAVTDESGHFSASREIQEGGWARAQYEGEPGWAYSPIRSITPKAAPTRFILDRTDFHLTANDPLKVGGTLEYQSGDQWKPLAGIPVEMDYKDSSTSHAIDATTDENGRFTLSTYAYGNTTYEVGFPPYPYNAWIQRTAHVDVNVAVTSTTRFPEFTARLDEYANLEVTGSVDVVGNYFSGQVAVDIQYSPNGSTGWTTKKTVKTSFGTQFIVDDIPGYTDGYWRLRYAGSTTKDIKGGTSKPLRRNRSLTRIKGANASPEPVRKGRTITVTGVLQEAKPGTTAWKAYGGRKVQILFRPKGTNTWYLMTTVTTKTNGSFSKGFKAQKDGTWVPVFLYPDSKHFVGSGTEDYVDVR